MAKQLVKTIQKTEETKTEANPAKTVRISYKDFVLKAIEKLRKPPYKGIHCVYSHLNDALRVEYPELEPRAILDKLVEQGVIELGYARGGVMVYKKGEAPERDGTAKAKAIVKQITGK